MEKKYELVEVEGSSYYRIRALRDFSDVKKGDIGGFVEGEHNLSHDGNCWIYDDARVCNNARVFGNARVYGGAEVCDDTIIYGNAIIYGDSEVYGNAEVYGDARVCNNAKVYGSAIICGSAEVCDMAKVCGNAKLQGSQRISNRAYITNTKQALSITGLGSVGRTTTFFLNEDSTIMVNCGCFNGTIDEFRKKVCESYPTGDIGKMYLLAAEIAKIRMENLN